MELRHFGSSTVARLRSLARDIPYAVWRAEWSAGRLEEEEGLDDGLKMDASAA